MRWFCSDRFVLWYFTWTVSALKCTTDLWLSLAMGNTHAGIAPHTRARDTNFMAVPIPIPVRGERNFPIPVPLGFSSPRGNPQHKLTCISQKLDHDSPKKTGSVSVEIVAFQYNYTTIQHNNSIHLKQQHFI